MPASDCLDEKLHPNASTALRRENRAGVLQTKMASGMS
jgi:hypothetical protein